MKHFTSQGLDQPNNAMALTQSNINMQSLVGPQYSLGSVTFAYSTEKDIIQIIGYSVQFVCSICTVKVWTLILQPLPPPITLVYTTESHSDKTSYAVQILSEIICGRVFNTELHTCRITGPVFVLMSEEKSLRNSSVNKCRCQFCVDTTNYEEYFCRPACDPV